MNKHIEKTNIGFNNIYLNETSKEMSRDIIGSDRQSSMNSQFIKQKRRSRDMNRFDSEMEANKITQNASEADDVA